MFALTPWRKEKTALAHPRSSFGLMRDFETFFDRFFGGWPIPLAETLEMPRFWGLEMEEKDKEVLVRAELPGFEPAELKLHLFGDVLTVEAEHKEEVASKEKTEEIEERSHVHVKRSVTLPAGTDLDKIEATYRNGVLEVHLPKTPEAVGRRIEIKA